MSDCYYGVGVGYRGNMNVTRSGRTCQSWKSQCPHRHWRIPKDVADSKMTRTCVVTQTAVPRMDHGVIQLTQMFDGNTATYLDVPLEVNLVIKRTYARAKERK